MVKISRANIYGAFVLMLIFIVIGIAEGVLVSNNVGATTSNLSMAATIQPSMTVTVSDTNKELNIIPSSEGTFGSTNITVGAYSNGSIGYTLFMEPSSASLIGIRGSIPTLESESTCNGGDTCTSDNFEVGHWGIAVDNAVYGPAAMTNLTTVANSNYTVVGNAYVISLGANFDLSVPMDSYSTTLNFTAMPEIRAYDITFNYDEHITDLTINDNDGNTVLPLSTSSGSRVYSLYYANTYTIVPTYASHYENNGITITTGAGLLVEGSNAYIVGEGAGVVMLTSRFSEPYLQEFTLSDCQVNVGIGNNPANVGDIVTVYDRRIVNYDDVNDAAYTVRYINGECWMTQNLRIMGVVSAADSNFSGDDFNVSEHSLDSTDASYDEYCDNVNGYENACAKDSGSKYTGVWYNFYAASAGTVLTYSDDTVTNEDICPANWHLPIGPNTAAGTDFNRLVGNTAGNYQEPTVGLSLFSAVAGGYYDDSGTLTNSGTGYWWSATARSVTSRHYLRYNSNNGQFSGDGYGVRSQGYFVRCVRSS